MSCPICECVFYGLVCVSIVLCVFGSSLVAHAAVVCVGCPTYECVFYGAVCFFCRVMCVSQLRGSLTWQLCGCLVPQYECVFHGAVHYFCRVVCVSQLRGSHTWQLCGCLVPHMNVFSMVRCVFSVKICVCRSCVGRTRGSCVGVLSRIRMCFPWCGVRFLFCCVCFAVFRSHVRQLCGCFVPHTNVFSMVWCVFSIMLCVFRSCVGRTRGSCVGVLPRI